MNRPKKRVKLSAIFESYSCHLSEAFRKTEAALEFPLDRGPGREVVLRTFLKEHLPKRYGVDTGFVINSSGMQSRHIDIIIYDALTCPVFSLDVGSAHNAYPVEGVYGMVEVKSTLTPKTFDEAWDNALALKNVARANIGTEDTQTGQPPTLSAEVVAASLQHLDGGRSAKAWRIQKVPPMAACFAYKAKQDWGRTDGQKWQMSAIDRLKACEAGYSLDVICVHDQGVLARMLAKKVRGRSPMADPEWRLMTSKQFSPFSLFYLHLLNQLARQLPERVNMMDYLMTIMKEIKAE